MVRPDQVPGDWSPREKWLRAMSCCDARPRCIRCPLREENQDRSLAELTG